MNNKIFIPLKIKIGYQAREGTYTGKLGYIIYYDAKGKLRKETSWQGWRDHEIPVDDYDNKPLSGFVLNKKAGGYSSGWNHRQTYSRVYDPRGFEFEITIPNLLYILDNVSSIRGKGLDGEFVYGWDGTELLLIPVDAPDYIALKEFSDTLHQQKKLKGKDLVLGGTYLNKNNEEIVYLGRFDLYEGSRYDIDYESGQSKGKYYFFKNDNHYQTFKYPSQGIIGIVSQDPVANYADLMDKLAYQEIYSPFERYEYILLTDTELLEITNKNSGIAYIEFNRIMHDIYIRPQCLVKVTKPGWYKHGVYDDYLKSIKQDEMSIQELHAMLQFKKRITILANGKIIH